ncbi:hypothetical protein SAMN05421810_102517 [Amycolatopsis arida]|uniref:Uncharacterized protein n=1 Tax=Amycolatopsis arida TaxID=587909 RepID=A0A1I5Q627_9PSEU|nr:hypothetical protein [Amycolatopsis arida]TDX98723.1 hypothetical protein CLV69_101518 [Amycolatopsis arida]SFP41421.1 hypothetical protein SAMN05421810_102517 [Amycolatopsis arida]
MNTVSLVAATVSFSSAVVTVLLGALFESRRRRGERDEERRHLVRRFRDPLLQAASGLLWRASNVIKDGDNRFLLEDTARHRDYVRYESAYRLAAYLGWVELLFREVRFVDLGNARRNRRLVELLARVQNALSEPIPGDQAFRLLGGEQRALGELMVRPPIEGEDAPRCLGFVEFHHRITTEERFAHWFAPLLTDIDRFAAGRRSGLARLTNLHNALVELVDFLDPKQVWILGPRERLPAP